MFFWRDGRSGLRGSFLVKRRRRVQRADESAVCQFLITIATDKYFQLNSSTSGLKYVAYSLLTNPWFPAHAPRSNSH